MSTQFINDKAAIYARLPHAGPMQLLDAVLSWNDDSIRCLTASHVDDANPLHQGHSFSRMHLLEYAAQAIAVHGSLLDPDGPGKLVYIAAFRDVDLAPAPLPQITETLLDVRATQLAAMPDGSLYAFSVISSSTVIAQGKATVAIAGELP
ncbi:hypothetical protein L861_17250 [Litchfieldella anticariensis FP35 = DSM 16096]|uniref:3-hydroxylacyl-ACP dehydratase n=1 Tax=Litchfieldella anticariensis (strain DSM 16096 / CECT 5854 / CIP 108499 / LMG 22089 / FP35) TaxID=1121939 RepID=S2L697_LITA3|nr:hypothetical protein [Halomonas anticariensis]EPC03289.1 hypothetical protein L861_17250 [Halomonas anticariensis FP35 = DSM 16096]